ncbi:MAG: FAD-dependent oxidoreductase [Pseudomonadota bacterium]
MSHPDIAIIGAGIAGLSAAVALAEKGITAKVFEAAPRLAPMGTSLSIWPNAMRCLDDWGLAQDVARAGAPITHVAWRDPSGRAFFAHDMSRLYERFEQPGICVRRSDIHDILAGAVPKGSLHLGHALETCSEKDGQVQLRFANGETHGADMVIAADGLWSDLRQKLLPQLAPKYSGYGAFLGLSPAPAPAGRSGEAGEYIGAKARIGVFETGRDTRYWFVVANDSDPHPSARPAKLSDVLPHLEGWPEALRTLVQQTASEHLIHASFYQCNVKGPWGAGRVLCIGDAMHPFVPNLGQGACQAIEDGHVLAEGIAAGIEPARMPDWMARQRGKRVLDLQQQAAKIGDLVQGMGGWHMPILKATRLLPDMGVMNRSFAAQFQMPDIRL